MSIDIICICSIKKVNVKNQLFTMLYQYEHIANDNIYKDKL